MSSSGAPNVALRNERNAISWSAVAAGGVAATGILALLYTFGAACGLVAVDADLPGTWKTLGIFMGAWGALGPLVALFLGGWVAARSAGVTDPSVGMVHGLTVWGVSVIFLFWLLTSWVGGALTGTATMMSKVADAGATLGAELGVGDMARQGGAWVKSTIQGMDLNVETLLAPINERQKQAGKREVTANQLMAAVAEVADKRQAGAEIDQNLLLDAIAAKTALSRNDAASLASDVRQRWMEAQNRLQDASRQAQDRLHGVAEQGIKQATQLAEKTAAGAARILWSVFAALGLGLLAAMAGALLGLGKPPKKAPIAVRSAA